MYGCESWVIKKTECQRIDAFELWCWRRLLSPLDSKEIKLVNPKWNQPWIFVGRKCQSFGHLMWRADLLEEALCWERNGNPLQYSSLENFMERGAWQAIVHGTAKSQAWLSNTFTDTRKDWRQEEKEVTEDKMVGWHHWLNGHEFEQTLEDGEWPGKTGMLQSMGLQGQTQLIDWTTALQEVLKEVLWVKVKGH